MNRIFLVGNGASLNNTNMDLLIGKPSMAVNKIHRFYDRTQWRPTHYVKVDFSAFDPEGWKEEILTHVRAGEQCLLWDAFRAGANKYDGNYEYIYDGIGDLPNVQYIPRCKHHSKFVPGWHRYCTSLNSIVTMVIWAEALGFYEIVLVGCDSNYTDPQSDHFDSDYYRNWDTEYVSRNNRNIKMAHDNIVANCKIPIYDATVNGHLTCYPKVSLEDLISVPVT